MGTWRYDLGTGQLAWSQNMFRLYGYDPDAWVPTIEMAMERIHRDDARRVEVELTPVPGASLQTSRFRLLLPDGSTRRIEAMHVGEVPGVCPDERFVVGVARDVTEQSAAARTLAVHEAGEALRAGADEGRVELDAWLQTLLRAVEMPVAALWLARGDDLEPVLHARASDVPAELAAPVVGSALPRAGDGLEALAWQRSAPVVSGPSGAADGDRQLRAAAAVAALRGGEVAGVLALYANHAPEAPEILEDALAALGRPLGAALIRLTAGRATAPLTTRELEILKLAAEGLAGHEIEQRLQVSRSTVKSHFEHIYAKLGVSNRVGAVARAMRDGLID
jgi:DNA-binding CsgD family transcriptional regulator